MKPQLAQPKISTRVFLVEERLSDKVYTLSIGSRSRPMFERMLLTCRRKNFSRESCYPVGDGTHLKKGQVVACGNIIGVIAALGGCVLRCIYCIPTCTVTRRPYSVLQTAERVSEVAFLSVSVSLCHSLSL